jgi:hypothetical protein
MEEIITTTYHHVLTHGENATENLRNWDWGVAQVVKCLPSKLKAESKKNK